MFKVKWRHGSRDPDVLCEPVLPTWVIIVPPLIANIRPNHCSTCKITGSFLDNSSRSTVRYTLSVCLSVYLYYTLPVCLWTCTAITSDTVMTVISMKVRTHYFYKNRPYFLHVNSTSRSKLKLAITTKQVQIQNTVWNAAQSTSLKKCFNMTTTVF